MPRKLRHRSPELPTEYESLLRPYARMFEQVMLPLARKSPDEFTDRNGDVRIALEDYQKRYWGHVQHPFLVRHGLELSGYYYAERSADGPAGLSKESRALIAAARELVKTSFDSYSHYDHLLLIW